MRRIHAFAAGLLLLAWPSITAAQSTRGTLQARIVDDDGAALPGVHVEVGCRCADCKAPKKCDCCPDERAYTAVSDSEGRVRFSLAPGRYHVTASLEGFAEAEVTGITVTVGAAAEVTVRLGSKENGDPPVTRR